MTFLRRLATQHSATSVLSKRIVKRLPSIRNISRSLPNGFTFWPKVFDEREQQLLLTVALSQLDASENVRVRRLQKDYRARNPISHAVVGDSFLPDEYYTFHEGHYDNVIRNYRETCLSSWPESQFCGLTPVLERLRALYPSQNTQTHVLHLASNGEILSHIDNVSASGGWILGLSLGATRMLRMESPNTTDSENFEIALPSGSVYLQRDDIRYRWTHAILPPDRQQAMCGQRVSVMIRDRKDA